MEKNEKNSIKRLSFLWSGLFNGVKNSLKKFSKKSLGKAGLFLVFGIMIFNVNLSSNKGFYNTASAESKPLLTIIMEKLNKVGLFFDKDSEVLKSSAKIGETLSTNPIGLVFKALLWGVVVALGQILKAVGFLFDLVIDQEFFRTLIDNEGLYTGWVIVRDMLNMFFMLLLLFSAFATIFQVEQYHLRKMIIMLVVMALLVNFSFPITRFVIDFSNSAMYFLAENLQGSAAIAKFTNFGGMLQETVSSGSSISALLLTIIFLFILICTIFGVAINLLIRILVFALLIVISPAGFVFAFFTGTKKMANEWWDALFKYAFMGPAMMFFLYLSVLMFDINSNVDYSKLNGSLPGKFATFIIPITFLWVGMIAANRFGGEGSAMAMNFAKKTRDKIKGYGQKAAWGVASGVANRTGIPGAAKARWNQFTADSKSKADSNAARLGAKIGVRGAKEKDVKRRAEEYKKNLYQPKELEEMAKKGDAAAAYRLAEDKDINQETYDAFMEKNKDDSLRKTVNSKVKQNRIDLVAFNNAKASVKDIKKEAIDAKRKNLVDSGHGAASGWDDDRVKLHMMQEEVTKEIGKLNVEKWADQDWSEMNNKLKGVNRAMMANAMHESFGKFKPSAVSELQKRINPNNTGALNKFGIPV